MDFTTALNEWKQKAEKVAGDTLELREGKKYIKVIKQSYVYCFIEKATGNVLKAAGWNKPAKHARGSIFTEEIGVGEHGAHYIVR